MIRCMVCNTKVDFCDVCGEEFQEGSTIFCTGDNYHFCSKNCLKEFYLPDFIETLTYDDALWKHT